MHACSPLFYSMLLPLYLTLSVGPLQTSSRRPSETFAPFRLIGRTSQFDGKTNQMKIRRDRM